MIRWLENVEPVSTPYWMKRLREGNNESEQDAQAFEEWDLSSIQEGQENVEEDTYVRLINTVAESFIDAKLTNAGFSLLMFFFRTLAAALSTGIRKRRPRYTKHTVQYYWSNFRILGCLKKERSRLMDLLPQQEIQIRMRPS
ncbi:MAG: hypothetical protein AAF196_15125 [Planctomycetota bacterium]